MQQKCAEGMKAIKNAFVANPSDESFSADKRTRCRLYGILEKERPLIPTP
jgi:hypothetical protein